MDSITHIALGAVIGEAIAGKKIGKQAMVWGALLQSLPDGDVVASLWLSVTDNLLVHRGIMHSFLFGVLASPVLALVIWLWYKKKYMTFWQWTCFFGLEIFTHLFIDAFNNYGTGWFEPFSHYRVSFNVLFVADPLFSFGLVIAMVALIIGKPNRPGRKYWTGFGLFTSIVYLSYALFNKTTINAIADKNFDQQQLPHTRWFTTPTTLNSWLWYVVAESDKGYYLGYHSVFDHNDSIRFQYFPRHDDGLKNLPHPDDLNKLKIFSQGYYTLEGTGDSLVFNDLRFGQIMGWNNSDGKFVFHYYLANPTLNTLVVQRGRLSGWDKKNINALFKRIKGH